MQPAFARPSASTIPVRKRRPRASRACASIWPRATGFPWRFCRRRARANTGADRDGSLAAFLNPDLSPNERTQAQVEGWILGVTTSIRRPPGVTRQRVEPPPVAPVQEKPRVGSRIDKVCPECSHAFRGGSCGGIDAHWKARHTVIMPYEDAWTIIKAGGKPSSRPSWAFMPCGRSGSLFRPAPIAPARHPALQGADLRAAPTRDRRHHRP